MKLKVLAGVLLFLIVVNLTAIGTFFYITKNGASRSSRRYSRTGESHYGLSRAEHERLEAMEEAFRDDTRDIIDHLEALEDSIFAFLQREPVPEDGVDSLLGEIAASRLDIAKRAADRFLELRDTLPTEQHAALFKELAEVWGFRRDHHRREGVRDRPKKRHGDH